MMSRGKLKHQVRGQILYLVALRNFYVASVVTLYMTAKQVNAAIDVFLV